MPEICVALLTPFTAAGDVALDAVAMHTEFLLAHGITALMPAGTTGEGVLLDPAEVVDLVATVTRVAKGRARVLAHIGRASTRDTVALAARVVEGGVAAVSAVEPYYYRYSDVEIEAHYRSLLRSVTVPVYAYTIPERTGNTLSNAVVRTLAAEGLRGVKDSTKSIERHREYLRTGVEVLMGSDALVREAFGLGAAGAISAIANIEPRLLLDLAASFASPAGADDQARLTTVRERTKRGGSAIAAMKAELAGHLPGYPTRMRAPLA